MDDWTGFRSDNCSVGRTLAIVGEKWTPLILREAFAGTQRFADFRQRLDIAGNLLSTRLNNLVVGGVMKKVPYREPGDRERYEYVLTDRGKELRPILLALQQWGDKYLADRDGPSIVVRHKSPCDEPVDVMIECAAGHGYLKSDDLYRTPGPGARFNRRLRRLPPR